MEIDILSSVSTGEDTILKKTKCNEEGCSQDEIKFGTCTMTNNFRMEDIAIDNLLIDFHFVDENKTSETMTNKEI